APLLGRRGDLAHHQLPVLRFQARAGPDLDVALDATVVGHHEADARIDRETPDQPLEPALEHFDDHALAAAAAVHAGDAGHRAVAVHDLAHFRRRQEQVVADAGVRAQEPEAVG